ncbi:hypothetical protein [Peptostreptococcus faecalis]|nr:hypothetical protein [Peptostreptococcus faecalis]
MSIEFFLTIFSTILLAGIVFLIYKLAEFLITKLVKQLKKED